MGGGWGQAPHTLRIIIAPVSSHQPISSHQSSPTQTHANSVCPAKKNAGSILTVWNADYNTPLHAPYLFQAETFDGHLVHANNRLMQIKTPLGLCFFPHPEGDQAMSQPSPPRQPPRPPQGPIRERAHPSPKPMSQHPTLHPPQRPLLSTPQPPWQPAPELEAEFCGVGKTGAAAATPMAGGESDRYGENRALSRRHSHSAAEATENGDHLSHQIPKPDDGSRLSFL